MPEPRSRQYRIALTSTYFASFRTMTDEMSHPASKQKSTNAKFGTQSRIVRTGEKVLFTIRSVGKLQRYTHRMNPAQLLATIAFTILCVVAVAAAAGPATTGAT